MKKTNESLDEVIRKVDEWIMRKEKKREEEDED